MCDGERWTLTNNFLVRRRGGTHQRDEECFFLFRWKWFGLLHVAQTSSSPVLFVLSLLDLDSKFKLNFFKAERLTN